MCARISILLLAALLTGCATTTTMHNAQTGQTTKCGGGIWTLNSAADYDRCVKWFHQLSFDPVP